MGEERRGEEEGKRGTKRDANRGGREEYQRRRVGRANEKVLHVKLSWP